MKNNHCTDLTMLPYVKTQIMSNLQTIDDDVIIEIDTKKTVTNPEEETLKNSSNKSLGIICEECDNVITTNQLSLFCNNCELFFHKDCTDKKGAR